MSARSAETKVTKQLRIQLGVCKRMVKEVASYEKEVLTNEEKVQKMRDEGKDPYDIRKQEDVLQESYMMIPDSKSRLEKSIHELTSMVREISADPELDATILGEAEEIIATNTPAEEEIEHEEVGEDEVL
mmetsp:Transcript_15316/g.25573  ORF Transcript_15316/g.25573 Transcript_15316/m.25573 type:complete len:130 (+) Transcript_15316:90-479(+)